MIIMTYQTFNKYKNYVTDERDEKIIVPDFVNRARKRYRFDEITKILEKQCSGCEKWYTVTELKEGEWNDIHDEEDIHKMNSGFHTYCEKCRPNRENKKLDTIKNGKQDKCSVYLTDKQRKYLKMRAAAEGIPMKALLSEIIDCEIEKKPIGSFL